jgi:hypothetical protein
MLYSFVCFLLGNFPASEFYMPTFRNNLFHLNRRVGTYPPMKMEQTECSEGSKYKIQTPGNYPEESIQHSEHFFLLWRCDPTRVMASHSWGFLDHTQRRTTFGSSPLDEWFARRRDLYLTTHNTHNRQTSIPWWDSNPRSQQTSGRRPLDRAATGTGALQFIILYK